MVVHTFKQQNGQKSNIKVDHVTRVLFSKSCEAMCLLCVMNTVRTLFYLMWYISEWNGLFYDYETNTVSQIQDINTHINYRLKVWVFLKEKIQLGCMKFIKSDSKTFIMLQKSISIEFCSFNLSIQSKFKCFLTTKSTY